jgi:hypothetical protein
MSLVLRRHYAVDRAGVRGWLIAGLVWTLALVVSWGAIQGTRDGELRRQEEIRRLREERDRSLQLAAQHRRDLRRMIQLYRGIACASHRQDGVPLACLID